MKKLIEEKKLRLENAKTYRDENGVYHMRLTQNRLHYMDTETGVYEEGNGLLRRTESGYMTTNGRQNLFFDCSAENGNELRIEKLKSDMSVRFNGAREMSNRVVYGFQKSSLSVDHSRKVNDFELCVENGAHKPSIMFKSIDSDIYIEYLSGMSALKQNIIINKKRKCYIFDFTVSSERFVINTDTDHSVILFYEKQSERTTADYFITSPILVDKNGNKCENVFFKVKRIKSNQYRITVVADADWINREKTCMPVVVESSFVYSDFYENKIELYVISQIQHTLDKKNLFKSKLLNALPEIPRTAKIINCKYINSSTPFQGYLYDDTEKIQNKIVEVGGENKTHFSKIWNNVFELDVEYIDCQDFFENQEIYELESGSFEKSLLNMYTGRVFIARSDIQLAGPKIPIEISAYYDLASYSDSSICNSGSGWKLSIQQSIERIADDDDSGYVYTDAWGKRHYLMRDNKGEFKDSQGLGLTLSGILEDMYCISDRDRNKFTFDSNGNLVKINDLDGNSITYTYENGRIRKVTDSFGRTVELIYDDNSILKELIDPQMRHIVYNYNDVGELISVNYSDGSSCDYTYDANHRIISYKSRNDIQTTYTYESVGDRVLRIAQYAINKSVSSSECIKNEAPILGKYVIFDYRSNRSTTLIDNNDIRKVYIFDRCGRPVLKYNDLKSNKIEDNKTFVHYEINRYERGKCVFDTAVYPAGSESKNYIENGAFSNDIIEVRVPYGWSYDYDNQHECVVDVSPFVETKAFCIKGGIYSKILSQTLDVKHLFNEAEENRFGTTFVLSAWAKIINSERVSDLAKLEIRTVVQYSDGSSDVFTYEYDADYKNWQLGAVPIVIDNKKEVTQISVCLDSSFNCSDIYFSNIQLVKSLPYIKRYEDDVSEYILIFGTDVKIVRRVIENYEKYTIVTEMDTGYMPVRVTVIDLDGNKFVTVNEFDWHHNLKRTQNYRGIVTIYEYNAKGALRRSWSYHSNEFNSKASLTIPDKCFKTEYNFDKNGEYLRSIGNPKGNYIDHQYDYDWGSGLLNYDINESRTKISYSYDYMSKLPTSVFQYSKGQAHLVTYGYNQNFVTCVNYNGVNYEFDYDGFGEIKAVYIAGNPIWERCFKIGDVSKTATLFATGESDEYIIDNNNKSVAYYYAENDYRLSQKIMLTKHNEYGRETELVDYTTDDVISYVYNDFGNIVGEKRNGLIFKYYDYDRQNRLTKSVLYTSDEILEYTYIYETRDDGVIYFDFQVINTTLNNNLEELIEKDEHRRVKAKRLRLYNRELLSSEYEYLQAANLTGIVEKITRNVNNNKKDTLKYTYDNAGNISCVYKNDELIVGYEYDGFNRIVRENSFILGFTSVYKYDSAGNIISKNKYYANDSELGPVIETNVYTYSPSGWTDRMISNNGQIITYDSIGNPVVYLGRNMEWTRINLLERYGSNRFEYNARGNRIKKNDTLYELDGEIVISETLCGETIRYYYIDKSIIGFRFKGEKYYYQKNLQGDITEIYDDVGNMVGEYAYDAFGACEVLTDLNGIASVNPFRFRSRYFDRETGFYYFEKKYFDPNTGRFINAFELKNISAQNTQNMYLCHSNDINNKNSSYNEADEVSEKISQYADKTFLYLKGGNQI